MKKVILSLTAVLALSLSLVAQDSAEKMMKNANKALSSWSKDEFGNIDKLGEAQSLIDAAISSGELASNPKAYLIKAAIYQGLMKSDVNAATLNPSHALKNPLAGVETVSALQKAFMLSEGDKGARKSVFKSIEQAISYLNTLGYSLYQAKNFGGSSQTFDGMIGLIGLMQDNDVRLPFESPDTDIPNLKYMAGVTSMLAEDNKTAERYLSELLAMEYDEPGVYNSLVSIYADQPEKAEEILTLGRERYPANTQLLFSEINFYLQSGELEKLISKLEAAKEAEPNNASVDLTLGNVYDQLMQQSREAGDMEASDKYKQLAMAEYVSASEKDPMNANAFYSMGALHFNGAVQIQQKMSDLPLSAQKEYNALQEQFKAEMDAALPFFKKAEVISPGDLNTLIALKEITAQSNDFDASNEFKARIEKVQSGETITTSYYAE